MLADLKCLPEKYRQLLPLRDVSYSQLLNVLNKYLQELLAFELEFRFTSDFCPKDLCSCLHIAVLEYLLDTFYHLTQLEHLTRRPPLLSTKPIHFSRITLHGLPSQLT